MRQDRRLLLRQVRCLLLRQGAVLILYIYLFSTADIGPVSAADICPVSTADISPVSTEDIYPVSTEDIKAWTAEAATAADQGSDGQSLACGGRDSGRPKSLHGAMDDPSLTAKQNRHRHMSAFAECRGFKQDVGRASRSPQFVVPTQLPEA